MISQLPHPDELAICLAGALPEVRDNWRAFSPIPFSTTDGLHAHRNLLPAWRARFTTHRNGRRCSPREYASYKKAIETFREISHTPVDRNDLKPSGIDRTPPIPIFRVSEKGKRIMAQYRELRFGGTAQILPEADRRKPAWDTRLRAFLTELAEWKHDDHETPRSVFHQRAIIHQGIFALIPPSPLYRKVTTEYVTFLALSPRRSEHPVEWLSCVDLLLDQSTFAPEKSAAPSTTPSTSSSMSNNSAPAGDKLAGYMSIEKLNFRGWPNSYQLSNGIVDLIITGDVGPRVIHYGFTGGPNFFKEFDEMMGSSGEAQWMIRGGHRLWKGPEDRLATYALDNGPVEIVTDELSILALQPVERETGLRKSIRLTLSPDSSAVEVLHRIENTNALSVELAAWTPTVMAPGGVGITGWPPRGTHPEMLEPTNPIIMWAFTDLSDPRWKFTKKYLLLRQDPANPVPQKLGHFNDHTWGAYSLHGGLFLKQYFPDGFAEEHPEFGASFEIFTNGDFLELETMGPLTQLAHGEALTHTELWSLHPDVSLSAFTDDELDTQLLPLLS